MAKVSEKAVDTALTAFFDFLYSNGASTGADGPAMCAALDAALPHILGEPVGYMTADGRFVDPAVRNHFPDAVPVYAPIPPPPEVGDE